MRIITKRTNHQDLREITCPTCGTEFEVNLFSSADCDASLSRNPSLEVSQHPMSDSVDYCIYTLSYYTDCPTCGRRELPAGWRSNDETTNRSRRLTEPENWVDVYDLKLTCMHIEGESPCTQRGIWLVMKPDSDWLHLAPVCGNHSWHYKNCRPIAHIRRELWQLWVPTYMVPPSEGMEPKSINWSELFKGLLNKPIIEALNTNFKYLDDLIKLTKSEFVAIDGLNLRTYYLIQGKLAEMGLKFKPE